MQIKLLGVVKNSPGERVSIKLDNDRRQCQDLICHVSSEKKIPSILVRRHIFEAKQSYRRFVPFYSC